MHSDNSVGCGMMGLSVLRISFPYKGTLSQYTCSASQQFSISFFFLCLWPAGKLSIQQKQHKIREVGIYYKTKDKGKSTPFVTTEREVRNLKNKDFPAIIHA